MPLCKIYSIYGDLNQRKAAHLRGREQLMSLKTKNNNNQLTKSLFCQLLVYALH